MLYGNYCYIIIENFPKKFSPCSIYSIPVHKYTCLLNYNRRCFVRQSSRENVPSRLLCARDALVTLVLFFIPSLLPDLRVRTAACDTGTAVMLPFSRCQPVVLPYSSVSFSFVWKKRAGPPELVTRSLGYVLHVTRALCDDQLGLEHISPHASRLPLDDERTAIARASHGIYYVENAGPPVVRDVRNLDFHHLIFFFPILSFIYFLHSEKCSLHFMIVRALFFFKSTIKIIVFGGWQKIG